MAVPPCDLAIIGSTPFAALLAGLLVGEHKRRVCLVGEPSSSFRLARGIDLSVMPVTRPETWALLHGGTPETLRILARLHGRPFGLHPSTQKVDPLFVGETEQSIDALSHMRHVAAASGHAVERLGAGVGPTGGTAFRLRDATLLHRAALWPLLDGWLEKLGVNRIGVGDTSITLRRGGAGTVTFRGARIEAEQIVLADHAAILDHLQLDDYNLPLGPQTMTTVLTEPVGALAAPVLVYLDRGVTLMRQRRGNVVGLCAGPPAQAVAQIGACLAGHGAVRRAGQRVFRTLTVADGAPMVGSIGTSKTTVIAGLGTAGIFMAPALARLLAGKASPLEAAYFASHDWTRGADRATVADYRGADRMEAVS